MSRLRKIARPLVIGFANALFACLGPRALSLLPAKVRSICRVAAKRGDTIFLGGVYHVQTIQNWLDAVGPEGFVIAVEANPRSVLMLHSSFANVDNVRIVHSAIWSHRDKVTFTLSKTEYQGWARVVDPAIGEYPHHLDDTAYSLEVEANSIDQIVKDVGRKSVDVIYLTINDAQIKAIEGTAQMRQNKKLRMIMHSRTPYPANETSDRLREFGMKTSIKTLTRDVRRDDEDRIVTVYAHF